MRYAVPLIMSWDRSREDCLLAHRLKPALNNHRRWASWCRWPSFGLHATVITAAARIYLIDVINSLRLRAELRMTVEKLTRARRGICVRRDRAAWTESRRAKRNDREWSAHPHCPPMRRVSARFSLESSSPCFHNCRSVRGVFKATVLRSVNRLRHHVSACRRRELVDIRARLWCVCVVQLAITRFTVRFPPASALMDVEPTDNHMRETHISAHRRLDRRCIIFLAVFKGSGNLETR